MMESVSLLLAAGEATAQIFGVPLAASLANEIAKSCEEVAQNKSGAKMLGIKSMKLSRALEEAQEEGSLDDTKMQERIDEVVIVLENTRNRTGKWAKMSLPVRWWKRNDIQSGIEHLCQDLDTTLQIFSLKTQISHERSQKQARLEAQQNDAENKEMLRQILGNQQNLTQVARMHEAGETIARDIMQGGQMELEQMRSMEHSTRASKAPSSTHYLDMQRGLMSLHDLTGILPTIKILDGEITRDGEIAIAGGFNTDIWRGKWMGQKEVALKAIRLVKATDKKAQQHFVRELTIWSKLQNKHILQFYGIVTNVGWQICTVSPWLNNGNVLEYAMANPDVDKMHLLRGVAKGLNYLHSADIAHGNIKCSNTLVSDAGEACISDFGMAKAIAAVTKTSALTSLQHNGGTRWLAPEIVDGGSPSKSSDTYSFAMTILELITEKYPLAEFKNDISVIRAMAKPPLEPKRPTGDKVIKWLTDELWALMSRCWAMSPEERPIMEIVLNELEKM
ncbi:Dual specificity protein kinase splA [Leucoagaricus sp. SymC.cos]|nr:Dual specificity protein kinase splA [Leucoagaricus sp. SymC.cos]